MVFLPIIKGIRAFNILMGMSHDKVSILNYEDAIIIKAQIILFSSSLLLNGIWEWYMLIRVKKCSKPMERSILSHYLQIDP